MVTTTTPGNSYSTTTAAADAAENNHHHHHHHHNQRETAAVEEDASSAPSAIAATAATATPSAAIATNATTLPQPAPLASSKCSANKDAAAWSHQCNLERQAEQIIRRIHRLQSRQTVRHVDKQLGAFVRHEQSASGIGCQGRDGVRPVGGTHQNSQNYNHGLGHHYQHQASVRFADQGSCKNSLPNTNNCKLPSGPSSAEEKIKLFSPEGVKNLSTSALVSLVKQLENSSNSNHTTTNGGDDVHVPDHYSSTANHTNHNSSFPPEDFHLRTSASPSLEKLLTSNNNNTIKSKRRNHYSESSSLTAYALGPEEVEQAIQTVGTLTANLQSLEEDYDSDATESSSGGESADELICRELYSGGSSNQFHQTSPLFNSSSSRKHVPTLPILKRRAHWKWAVDRGAIASRWMWLIAQVADLEFKIRQQNELYRTLRHSKGQIILEANAPSYPPPPPPLHMPTINDQQAAALTTACSTTTTSPPTVTDNPAPAAGSEITTEDQLGTSSSIVHEVNCVRTLPVKQIRKRKLVRSVSALAGATRKMARLSTVQCSCSSQPPMVSPCLLCNGRYSYVQVIDTDCMPLYERVALLDPSFHSVLSLQNNVYLGLHFSKFLKKETIQKPVTAKAQYKKRKNALSPDFANKFGKEIRKSNHKKSQAVISSNKLRKKYDGTSKRKYSPHSTGCDAGGGKRTKRERHESSSNGSGESFSRQDSSLDGSATGPLNRRRRSEQDAYDINNIVIPYSIASTTRVEKLEYKEIVTPKWRIFETYAITDEVAKLSKTTELDAEMIEDLSEETFTIRHEICEIEEKHRLQIYRNTNTKTTKIA